jgi:rhodanese-related sulfurtransferase
MNKKNLILILFIFFSVFLSVYFFYFKKNNNFDKKKDGNFKKLIIINVLEKEFYDDANISGSIQCDIDNLSNFLENISKKSILVFYCANYLCQSSFEAAKIARKLGFENIFAYEGGIAEWYQKAKKNSDFKVSGPCKMQYLEVISLKKNIGSENEDFNVEKNDAVVNIISADDLQKMIKNNNI